MGAYAYVYNLSDYCAFIMQGRTKEGQTLDEVKDLFLGEIAKLKSGDFDENMLQANINNFKKYQIQQLEYNSIRADMFVQSFVNGTDWGRRSDRTGNACQKLTKADIVAFANKYFTDSNYAIIYKKTGKDPNEKKISKPEITPIVMNRDAASKFPERSARKQSATDRTCVYRLQQRYGSVRVEQGCSCSLQTEHHQ